MTTRTRTRTWTLGLGMASMALGAVGLLGAPSTAVACGGCFAPTETETVVTDHRMVMAIHPSESILWDQIRYSGNPRDFAWILPVHGEVTVEVASGDFFDQLEASTAPRVIAPPQTCPSTRSSFGTTASSPGAGTALDGTGVEVLHTAVVGPYETVTLRSSSTDGLTAWLGAHGYTIPAPVVSTIGYYNDMHMDFVAMRLRPGEGVSAMQPVRVRYASANTVLPLRMVAAGVADKVGITLWVISGGQYEAMNFVNGRINPDGIVWDFATRSSNYQSLFQSTVLGLGGRAWITEASGPVSQYHGSYTSPPGMTADGGTAMVDDWTLATQGLPAGWITRLRADLPIAALNQDLQLGASVSNTALASSIQATHAVNRPPCPTDDGLYSGTDNARGGFNCTAGPLHGGTSGRTPGRTPTGVVALGALAAIAIRRRR